MANRQTNVVFSEEMIAVLAKLPSDKSVFIENRLRKDPVIRQMAREAGITLPERAPRQRGNPDIGLMAKKAADKRWGNEE